MPCAPYPSGIRHHIPDPWYRKFEDKARRLQEEEAERARKALEARKQAIDVSYLRQPSAPAPEPKRGFLRKHAGPVNRGASPDPGVGRRTPSSRAGKQSPSGFEVSSADHGLHLPNTGTPESTRPPSPGSPGGADERARRRAELRAYIQRERENLSKWGVQAPEQQQQPSSG